MDVSLIESEIIDISVVLTVHLEELYLRRSISSITAAVQEAVERGYSAELVAVFDRSDKQTRTAFNNCDLGVFKKIVCLDVNNGDLAASRNDGIRAANGRFIMLADADDLVSSNMYATMAQLADASGPEVLFCPEYVVAFDGSYHVCKYFSLNEVSRLALIAAHPFVSRISGHASILKDVFFIP